MILNILKNFFFLVGFLIVSNLYNNKKYINFNCYGDYQKFSKDLVQEISQDNVFLTKLQSKKNNSYFFCFKNKKNFKNFTYNFLKKYSLFKTTQRIPIIIKNLNRTYVAIFYINKDKQSIGLKEKVLHR